MKAHGITLSKNAPAKSDTQSTTPITTPIKKGKAAPAGKKRKAQDVRELSSGHGNSENESIKTKKMKLKAGEEEANVEDS